MAKELSTGDKAPDFTAPCVRCGEFVLSSELKNNNVLLYFYPTNYGLMCTYYSERMNEFYDDFEKMGVKVFHVNPESVENHAKYMERLSSRYDHMSDAEQKISRMFGMIVGSWDGPDALTNRGFVLIDKNMVIRYIWRAEIPVDTRDLGTFISLIGDILRDRRK
ncbi:MAG: peroxiredoxin family protein [Methanomassiliicoccaceae archaeon]|nr:peroxiredoxin family protein [Methanomassiliicoccaceae archaeon]